MFFSPVESQNKKCHFILDPFFAQVKITFAITFIENGDSNSNGGSGDEDDDCNRYTLFPFATNSL